MDALTDSEKNILTRRANRWHFDIITQFAKTPIALTAGSSA
jgi:hypothetical protein